MGFKTKEVQSERTQSCDPLIIDRGLQQLIDHTVIEWQRVDSFLADYKDANRRAELRKAAEQVQTLLWGLTPLISYDGRLPRIAGLIAFADWVNSFYNPTGGNQVRPAIPCCAESLGSYFHNRTGDSHWREVARIVINAFKPQSEAEMKKNPARWMKKEVETWRRLWDKGKSYEPDYVPIKERSNLSLFSNDYYEKHNQRRQEKHSLDGKIYALEMREDNILMKILKAAESRGELKTKRQKLKAIREAKEKSAALRRMDKEIRALREKRSELERTWAREDDAEKQKIRKRSNWIWRRSMILAGKKAPRKRQNKAAEIFSQRGED